MTARNPEVQSRWNELLGPFWSTGRVANWLGTTETRIKIRSEQMRLLRLKTSDGGFVFPAFQFVELEPSQHHVVAGLDKVLEPFRDVVNREGVDWSLASWISAPRKDLGRKSIIDHLKLGGDVAQVVALARDIASRWAR